MAQITARGKQQRSAEDFVPVTNAMPPPTSFTTGSSDRDISLGSTMVGVTINQSPN